MFLHLLPVPPRPWGLMLLLPPCVGRKDRQTGTNEKSSLLKHRKTEQTNDSKTLNHRLHAQGLDSSMIINQLIAQETNTQM